MCVSGWISRPLSLPTSIVVLHCSPIPSIGHRWQNPDGFSSLLFCWGHWKYAQSTASGVETKRCTAGTHLGRLCVHHSGSHRISVVRCHSSQHTLSFWRQQDKKRQEEKDRGRERKVWSGICLLQIRGSVIILPHRQQETTTERNLCLIAWHS